MKGLKDSKAAEKARKEKEVRTKIVSDLILYDQKHEEKVTKRQEALLQK